MVRITDIHAREILDSRGNPTVEVDLILDDGSLGRAAVPAGASTGSHEAHELRDGDGKRYSGQGVLKAAGGVNSEIRDFLRDKSWDQKSLDSALIELDGTADKKRLGANAILGVSLAFAKAAAVSQTEPLYRYFRATAGGSGDRYIIPVPMMNVLNGGRHAENSTDIQEFMIVPWGAPSFKESLRWGAEIFHALKKTLSQNKMPTLVGDEGGFAPVLPTNEAALNLLTDAITAVGLTPGRDVALAIDAAVTEFYDQKNYFLRRENKKLTAREMIDWYQKLSDRHPVISIEDGLAEDDWVGWSEMTSALGDKIQIVGDDLFATNASRLHTGIERKAANAILIKPNQIGTVSETITAIQIARAHGLRTIVSHRSGETEDTAIADLAVGLDAGQIKTGSLARGERIAKYNQLLRLEEDLSGRCSFAGKSVYPTTTPRS